MELWDLLDYNRQPLYRTHQRGKKKNPGEYHTVVEVWTVNKDKKVLITLRDSSKEIFPDKWENTSGSALAGETSRQAAVRELMEETGIYVSLDALTLLGTCQEKETFHDIYICRCDLPVSRLTMQPGETVAAQWVSLHMLETMIEEQSFVVSFGKRLSYFKKEFHQYLDNL